MSEQALRALAASWRHTADVWEQQMKPPPTYYVRRRRDIEPAPSYGRSDIQNWINWLRSCAGDLEKAMTADAVDPDGEQVTGGPCAHNSSSSSEV